MSSGLEGNRGDPPEPSGLKRAWLPILTVLIFLGVCLTLITPGGRHQWAESLFRQPTRYTALYFNRPDSLPRVATKDRMMYLQFTIRNYEGSVVPYRYVITATGHGVRRVLQRSTRIIPNGRSWNVATVVRARCAGSPCRIEVSLPEHRETIDFVISLKSARKRQHL